jgi:hypothetical protein
MPISAKRMAILREHVRAESVHDIGLARCFVRHPRPVGELRCRLWLSMLRLQVRRENQGQHRHLLSHPVAGRTFGNRPIAVKARAVSDPCPAAVKVGSGSTWPSRLSCEQPESALLCH